MLLRIILLRLATYLFMPFLTVNLFLDLYILTVKKGMKRYVEYKEGQLFCDDGTLYLQEKFSSEEEAEKFLFDNDLRASIR